MHLQQIQQRYGSEIPMKHSGVAQFRLEAAAPKGSLLEESS